MLRCQDEITFHEDNQLECLSRRSRRNQRLESERNDLTQEELRARQEKSPGREDYSGEIWIFAPSRGKYVAATGSRDSRDRAAPLSVN